MNNISKSRIKGQQMRIILELHNGKLYHTESRDCSQLHKNNNNNNNNSNNSLRCLW